MAFSKLHLSPPILRALVKQGYTDPTPIQAQAIPIILEGRDVLGVAQTGTGKTAAFALPILDRLLKSLPDKAQRGHRHARVLVLSPTRELGTQIGESFATYGVESGISHTVIFGGVSQYHQVRAVQHGVDIIIATPGRLIDLMEQGIVNLSHIETLVLDEADRMLDMGFILPIRKIAAATPAKRQTLLFSATMPTNVAKLAASLLREPVRIALAPTTSNMPKIEQCLYHLQRNDKMALLMTLLGDPDAKRVVVFTKTKHGADRVGRRLIHDGVRTEMIHGNKAQSQRTRALDRFRTGHARVLVATDVAARGLDVDGITHVINMDLPMDPEAYIHRIGRTGRAGASGIAISFCDQEERGLLRDIERLIGKQIPTKPLPQLIKIERDDRPMSDDHAPSQSSYSRSRGDQGGRGDRLSRGPRAPRFNADGPPAGGPPRDFGPPRGERPTRSAPRPNADDSRAPAARGPGNARPTDGPSDGGREGFAPRSAGPRSFGPRSSGGPRSRGPASPDGPAPSGPRSGPDGPPSGGRPSGPRPYRGPAAPGGARGRGDRGDRGDRGPGGGDGGRSGRPTGRGRR